MMHWRNFYRVHRRIAHLKRRLRAEWVLEIFAVPLRVGQVDARRQRTAIYF